jgi:hypothetical protein
MVAAHWPAARSDFFVKLKRGPRRPIFQVMSDVRARIENQCRG